MRISVRRHGVLCLIFVGLLLTGFTFSASAQTTASGTFVYLPLIVGTSIEDEVVALVNQQRHLNGCNVDLTISAQLSAAALRHSRDMALNDFFSHNGSDQSTMISRVVETGYTYSLLAENIQAGAQTAQQVVNDPEIGWMRSPGHRANILNCSLRETGIGYYYQADDQPLTGSKDPLYYYWTEDFATPLP